MHHGDGQPHRRPGRELYRQVGRRRIYDITGLPVHAMHPLLRLMWIREHEPDVFARTTKMLCWSELITSLLGAAPVSDYSVASRTMAFDIRRQEWSGELLAAAGIDPSLMPGLAQSGTVIGEVPRRIGADLGVAPRAKVSSPRVRPGHGCAGLRGDR